MNIDQLRARFPDENACREFFESVIWQNGRRCPHCDCQSSYLLSGRSSRPGLYECGMVQTPIYRDHQNADAQHQVAIVEVAAVYVFHG